MPPLSMGTGSSNQIMGDDKQRNYAALRRSLLLISIGLIFFFGRESWGQSISALIIYVARNPPSYSPCMQVDCFTLISFPFNVFLVASLLIAKKMYHLILSRSDTN